jgi:hypothetical protein
LIKDSLSSLQSRFWTHIKPLLILGDHKRPLGFMAISALSVGLPAIVGAWLDVFSAATIACMGGLVILYMRQTHISRRMMTLAVCSFGFSVSFAVGVLTSFDVFLSAFSLTLTAFLATFICRFYSVPPPGSLFFIMVACIARTIPFDLTQAAQQTGILLFGCMGACLLAFAYSVYQHCFQKQPEVKPAEVEDHQITAIALESSVISLFIGGGYLLALLVDLENPYWVPISTAAIMQGATFRAIWHRNVHRIIGTAIGMAIAWVIFSLSPVPWVLAVLILILSFIIEVLITRNYGLAVMFITPLTVIFADTTMVGVEINQLIQSRLLDIILGSCIGYLGGWVIHHTRFFRYLERVLSKG